MHVIGGRKTVIVQFRPGYRTDPWLAKVLTWIAAHGGRWAHAHQVSLPLPCGPRLTLYMQQYRKYLKQQQ
jgi:hypothetical protein